MNSPEYIFTDVMADVVGAVKAALSLPVLNYQFGYIMELDQTLKQYEQSPENFDKKFPIVFLVEPYTEVRSSYKYWSDIKDARVLILHGTDKTIKAADRMETVYKPILLPIYREFMRQIKLHPSIEATPVVAHQKKNLYYWGESQKSVLEDPVDCIDVSALQVKLKNNMNC